MRLKDIVALNTKLAKVFYGTVICLALAIQTTVSYSHEPSAEEGTLKYYLMIAEPGAEAWAGAINAGGDMAESAGKDIENMGGQLISYWLGVGEAKNYGVVAFPDSMDIARITYLRASQGIMKNLQFIEVMPSSSAVAIFADVKKMKNN